MCINASDIIDAAICKRYLQGVRDSRQEISITSCATAFDGEIYMSSKKKEKFNIIIVIIIDIMIAIIIIITFIIFIVIKSKIK